MNAYQYQPRSINTSVPNMVNTSVAKNTTYHGLVITLQDAILILEGIRVGVLPKVQRRLNDFERKCIVPGSIYAWNESELCMKRWTDGKSWLASKVKGPFLIYQEHDGARNVKANGLIKQSFSLTTKQNEKFHLIAYFDPAERAKGITTGRIPSQDPFLLKLQLDPSVYLTDFLHYGTRSSSLLPPPNFVGVPQNLAAFPSPSSSTAPVITSNNANIQNMMAYPGQMYSAPQSQAYYCHPLMMSYQYVANNTVQAASPTYQYPQQLVYMQLMPAPGHLYVYGIPPMNTHEQEGPYSQTGSQSAVISGLPTPALSSAHGRFSLSSAATPTTATAQYPVLSPVNTNPKSPTLSDSRNAPTSPQSIPSPSLHSRFTGYPTAKLEQNPGLAGPMYGMSQGNIQACGSQNQDLRTLKGMGKPFYV